MADSCSSRPDCTSHRWLRAALSSNIENAAGGARPGIVRCEYHARHARQYDGAGAHRAGFQRDEKFGARETVVAGRSTGFAKRFHLRVGCGVRASDHSVPAPARDAAVQGPARRPPAPRPLRPPARQAPALAACNARRHPQAAAPRSFPLDGGRRLGRYVVGHARNAGNLVDDAARHAFKQLHGQAGWDWRS